MLSSWFGSGKKEDENAEWKDPESPDYMAVRIAVVAGKCGQRDEKKKINPDPYVMLRYEHNSWETKTLHNTTSPKWNEVFEIPIPPESRDAPGEVGLSMWDRNVKDKKPIFHGEVRVTLSDYSGVNYEYVQPRKYKLTKRNSPAKNDQIDGALLLKVGMVMPSVKKKRSDRVPKEDLTETELVEEAEEVIEESYETVMRSLKLAENTRQLAIDTNERLVKQGDQLRNIQEGVDGIDELQDKADRHMRAINSVGGAVGNKFRRKKSRQDHVKKGDKLARRAKTGRQELEEEAEDERKQLDRKLRSKGGAKLFGLRKGSDDDDGYAEKYHEDMSMLSEESQKKEKEIQRGVNKIDSLLDDMKVLAVDMGDELDDHNRRLRIIDGDLDRAAYRMKETNRKIKKDLGK